MVGGKEVCRGGVPGGGEEAQPRNRGQGAQAWALHCAKQRGDISHRTTIARQIRNQKGAA